jgi:hypothetical protein
MPKARSEVGRLTGYRQVTLYVEPNLYEKVRRAASTLGEDIYEFVGEALAGSIERRMSKKERDAIDLLVKQNIKNGASREKRR